MSSKNSLFLLKSILLIQILLSISAIYYAYPGLASTYDQGNTAIWITVLVFLYWIILGPLFVLGLKHPELHQRMLLFLGGITVIFMLGLLVLLFV